MPTEAKKNMPMTIVTAVVAIILASLTFYSLSDMHREVAPAPDSSTAGYGSESTDSEASTGGYGGESSDSGEASSPGYGGGSSDSGSGGDGSSDSDASSDSGSSSGGSGTSAPGYGQ